MLIDKENRRYQLLVMGWEGYKRRHAVALHFDIINGKVWVQQDQTAYGVADGLLYMGIRSGSE